MNIHEAVEAAREGKKLKHKDWAHGYITFEPDSANPPRGVFHFFNEKGQKIPYVASHADLSDPQWEEVV